MPLRLNERPGLVGALLVGRADCLLEHALDLEIRKLFVAVVAQDQRLAAIADEHEAIVADAELGHGLPYDIAMSLNNIDGERRRFALDQTLERLASFAAAMAGNVSSSRRAAGAR